MTKIILATLLLLLIYNCSSEKVEAVEINDVEVVIKLLTDGRHLVTIETNDSIQKKLYLDSNGEVEKIISPIEFGQEILTFDPITGYLSTKVIKDSLEQIQGVAYDFSRYGFLKGAYKMRNGKNDSFGFLYKDGLNNLDAVFLYDSLGNLVETREY